jgi:GntR family transcriptional regulator
MAYALFSTSVPFIVIASIALALTLHLTCITISQAHLCAQVDKLERIASMPKIDKQSHVPYYIQLADMLRQFIRGAAKNGEMFIVPSENELASTYQISRATVRQALALIQREGLIYKTKGKGAFVAKHRVKYDLNTLIPTTDDMVRRGWKPGVKIISSKELKPPRSIADALEIVDDAAVYELCRLRLGDNEPISLQWSYLPVPLCPGLLEHDLTTSLTHLLEERYGIRLWTAHEILRARLPTNAEAKLLRITTKSPVIYMERITSSPTGIPVEFLKSVWRSDRYDFVFSLSRAA